jgi:rSAM/selenodomain-associated transferase 1
MVERKRAKRHRIAFANHLVIMAKSPRAGQAKRRLGADIGPVAACRIYRACLAHTLRRLGADPRWHTILAVTPDSDATRGFWPRVGRSRSLARLGQGAGDLGQRMQRLFVRLPPGPVIIVGTDVASLRPSHIAHAFRLLGANDAVLGPAQDGGFWLIGLKRSPHLLAPFSGVRWSSPHTLADTLANLAGRRVAYAATLADIDTANNVHVSREIIGRLVLPCGK